MIKYVILAVLLTGCIAKVTYEERNKEIKIECVGNCNKLDYKVDLHKEHK